MSWGTARLLVAGGPADRPDPGPCVGPRSDTLPSGLSTLPSALSTQGLSSSLPDPPSRPASTHYSSSPGGCCCGSSDSGSESGSPRSAPSSRDAEVVVTPWHAGGVPRGELSLAGELLALQSLLQLTPEEQRARGAALRRLRAAAQRRWPGSAVSVLGSFAHGCSLPESAVDLACEGWGGDPAEAAAGLAAEGGFLLHSCETAEEGADGAACTAVMRRGALELRVVLASQGGAAAAASGVDAVAALLAIYPAVRTVYCLLRTLVRQLRGGCGGAVPSHALLLMACRAAQLSAAPSCPAQLLVDFLAVYSDRPDGPAELPQELLVPQQPGGAPQTAAAAPMPAGAMARLRQVFAQCAQALAAWARPGSPASAACRSPLSAILSYDTLWERAEHVAAANEYS